MPKSKCSRCAQTYTWSWDEAFEKFGFNDGDGDVHTNVVAEVLRNAGYKVECQPWGCHNHVIESIKRRGIERIPSYAKVGYDDPRDYLPGPIIALLDAQLGKDVELAEGSVR